MQEKIILYNQKNYHRLIEKLSRNGYEVFSISNYFNQNFRFDLTDIEDEKVVIDISSVNFKKIYFEEQLYQWEELIGRIDENVKFISEDFGEHLTYILKYMFSDIEYFSEDIESEKSKHKEKKSIIPNLDNEEITELLHYVTRNLYGQKRLKKDLSSLIKRFKLFHQLKEEKILSIFILGESGVGKTEFARLLYKFLGAKGQFIKINFGNYSSQDSLNSLIGSPRGYTGSETGELFSKYDNAKEGIILIDEFEKANTPVFNYFLELLETGIATSSQGKEIDLTGFTIIFTSNVNTSDFYKVFSPELISRFQYICYFEELSIEDKISYVAHRIEKLTQKSKLELDIKLKSKDVLEYFKGRIKVEKFNNIRILNREINQLFLKYLEKQNLL